MMKKIISLVTAVIFISILFPVSIYSEDIIINEDTPLESYDAEQYLPREIKDIFEKYETKDAENVDIESILNIVGKEFKRSFSKYASLISFNISVLFFSALLKRIINNDKFLISENYIITLLHIVNIFGVFSSLLISSEKALSSLSDLISVLVPSMCAILLSSGCSFSALASSTSLGVALSFINDVVIKFLAPLTSILMILMIFEKMIDYLSDTGLFALAKNIVMNTMKFITTMLISLISFQSLLGASKDSLSMRAVKFAAVNFIPVVGGAVSESMRTISAGMKLLRTSVGGSFILAILLSVLPLLVDIFLIKTIFSLISMLGALLSSGNERTLYSASVDILNILNGIIIFSILISVISIILFITTGYITSY